MKTKVDIEYLPLLMFRENGKEQRFGEIGEGNPD